MKREWLQHTILTSHPYLCAAINAGNGLRSGDLSSGMSLGARQHCSVFGAFRECTLVETEQTQPGEAY